MKLGAIISLTLSPLMATAQGVADFDLTSVDFQSAGLVESFVIRDYAAHFASFRCPSCEGEHAHSIRISRMTAAEWSGGSFEFPTQQALDADCDAQMKIVNEIGEVIEACQSQIVDLPEPLLGLNGTMTIKAGALNDWRSFEIGAVIAHESGVIQINASDDDQERGTRNVMALLEIIAQAVSATMDPAE